MAEIIGVQQGNVETTLKAIAIQAYGGPEGLAVVDLPVPVPAAGHVLIATEAVGWAVSTP